MNRKDHFIALAIFFFFSVCFVGEIWAEVSQVADAQMAEFQPVDLKIKWSSYASTDMNDQKKQKIAEMNWLKACTNLDAALTVGKGPWGYGIVADSACWLGSKKLHGKVLRQSWTLDYKETDDKGSLTLNDENGILMSKIEMPQSEFSVQFFQDREYVDLIVLALLDDLPAVGFVDRSNLSENSTFKRRLPMNFKKGNQKFQKISPPTKLKAFSLVKKNADPPVFFPQIIGEMTESKTSAEIIQPVKNGKLKAESPREETVLWELSSKQNVASGIRSFWFHNANGRGTLKDTLSAAIENAGVKLDEAAYSGNLNRFIKDGSSNLDRKRKGEYLGIRYGTQILSGDPLLSKTNYFGLIADVRGGFLRGIRFHFDNLPRRDVDQNGYDTYIEWNRIIVGKSFGLDLKYLADRVDLTPKVGVWNFHAVLPKERDLDGNVTGVGAFELQRALSLAIEFGIEWYSPMFAMRTWYGFDGATVVSKVSSKKVTSDRFGIDGIVNTGPKFRLFGSQFRSAFLAFIVSENMQISHSSDDLDAEASDDISKVNLIGLYAGVGVGLSW